MHVMQMCNALSKKGYKVTLIIPTLESKNEKAIKRNFAIKYDFEIKPIFKDLKKMNFFTRILFGISCLNFLERKKKTVNYIQKCNFKYFSFNKKNF